MSAETGAVVERAALAAVGSRFRLHGRAAATGLDCVGLVALALRAGGCVVAVPTGYALLGGDPVAVAAWLDRVLARRADSRAGAAGDVLMLRTGPAQLHFAVRSARGIVHADAVLKRVVERPGPVAEPVLGCWRPGVQSGEA